MDPDQALKNLRETLKAGEWELACDAAEALDGWLSKGGFLPKEWKAGRPKKAKYVLTYEHRSGNDVSYYTTRTAALKSACVIIVDWWDEIDEVEARNDIRRAINAGRWDKALEHWRGYQNETTRPEYMSIEEVTTPCGPIPGPIKVPDEEKVDESDDDEDVNETPSIIEPDVDV